MLHQPVVEINVGLQDFTDAFERQDTDLIQVVWSPPAGGDQELIELPDELYY